MSRNHVIYAYPLIVDIVVGLALFVGRHSLAARGHGEATVGSVLLCYGIGYCAASLTMPRVVRVRHARWQMLVALLLIAAACGWLARATRLAEIRAAFFLLPAAVSLFFNAYQAFMLEVATGTARPLAATAGHYTCAWSLGYALGPLVSGLCREHLAWGSIYLVAAALSLLVALVAALLRPRPGSCQAPPGRPGTPPEDRGLMVAAWLGVAVAWTGWNALSTFWPVQAQQLGLAAHTRGGVEFVFALTQSVAALAFVFAGPWQHRPARWLWFGGCGVAALLLFAGAQSPPGFVAAAMLYGAYTSSAFSLMVYHSLFDPERAVRRVAINEAFVGLSFLAGPLLARGLRAGAGTFSGAYLLAAGVIACGVAIQVLWAARRCRRDGHHARAG